MATIAELSLGRVFCDFIVLLCLALPLLIFQEWVQPVKRGFYCDDESIRYPYKASTVTRQLLIVVGILIPTILIFLTEMLRAVAWERRCADEFGTYYYRKYSVHRLIIRLYVFIGYFLLGVCFNQLMVDIAKYTIGRHRPHFMDVCKPFTQINTRRADGTTDAIFKDYRTNCPSEEHSYISDFECRGDSEYLIHESKLSFYSGHSAFSFYAAWYTSLYLQARVYRPLLSRLVLPAVQFSLFGGAAFVSYTRVSDYKHHWSDVLVGVIIGSIIGIINAFFIAEVFQRREVPTEYRCQRRMIGKYSKKAADLEAGNMEMQDIVSSQPPQREGNTTNYNNRNQMESVSQQQQQVHNIPIRVNTRTEGIKYATQLQPRRF